MIEIVVPPAGESVTEGILGEWMIKTGDFVEKDQTIVEIETDKITVELPAPESGKISELLAQSGDTVEVGQIIAKLQPGVAQDGVADSGAPAEPAPLTEAKPTEPAKAATGTEKVMPSAAKALSEKGLAAGDVKATGPGGRLLKEDVMSHTPASEEVDTGLLEEIKPMSPMRRRIAERLVEAQQTAALLTTFNEIDMTPVMKLRKKHQESFIERYGIKLGFMSFFTKAVVDALKRYPAINAEIRGTDIIYKNHYDIGIAIGSGKGLVVPIVRGSDRMSFSEIELAIADFAKRIKENKLELSELMGGTFTISNGGVYGSLLSTPIVNPPQSGILGLHSIQKRPVVDPATDEIVVRSMMYVALTYDHRIVDGREAVAFLKRIKDVMEDPNRLFLEV